MRIAKPVSASQAIGPNPNTVEDEYIDNLQQQIHFMELELKLLKQKQEEEEKTGGAAALFVDEKTASQHLTQLKEKYQKMRKELDRRVSDLTQQKNEILGAALVLSQKLTSLTQQFRKLEDTKNEAAGQSEQLLARLESEYKKKAYERAELEQQLSAVKTGLGEEQKTNTGLKEQTQIKEVEDKTFQENLKNRIAQQEKLVEKLKANLESVCNETKARQESIDKNVELQKVIKQNTDLKASIEEKERTLARERLRVTELEHLRELNVKMKEDEINERRLLLSKNEELKKEIEAKDQINNMKIQKKLKDKTTGQLKELNMKWEENKKNLEELKEKIKIERDKIDLLEKDKIMLTNSLNIVQAQLKELREINDKSVARAEELKKQAAALEAEVSANASTVITCQSHNMS